MATREDEVHLFQSSPQTPHQSDEEPYSIGRSPFVRTRLQLVGFWNVVIISISFLACCLILAFLGFLWSWSLKLDSPQPQLWRSIVLSRSLSISITLSAAVLRTFMALQASIGLSMIAALSLESSGIPLRFAPLVLTLRGYGASTYQLLEYLWHAFRSNPLYNICALALIATTIASQLASTVLVSDLGPRFVLDQDQRASTFFGKTIPTDTWPEDLATQYWFSGVNQYPIFAEHAEPPANREDWKLDTGPTLRSFPPIRNSNERSRLASYTGYSTTLDTRFSCMPIEMEFRMQTGTLPVSVFLSGTFRAILPPHVQKLQSKISSPDLKAGALVMRFNCSLTFPDILRPEKEWAISVCDMLDFLPKASVRMSSPLVPDLGLARPPLQYLVINTTGNSQEWLYTYRQKVDWEFTTLDPWSVATSKGNLSLSFAMSYCAASFATVSTPISLIRGVEMAEPMVEWNANSSSYNATEVSKLYAGAWDGYSLQERGVLELQRRQNWTEGIRETMDYSGASFKIYLLIQGLLQGLGNDISIALCSACEVYPGASLRAHERHVAVFQRIIKSTGSLPLAMQTMWTILAQMAYYDFLPQYDMRADAVTTSFTEVLIPTRNYGRTAVFVITIIHNLVFGLVLLLFLFRARLSLIGNVWQSFGQMGASEFVKVASRSTIALDSEVTRQLEKDSLKGIEVQLRYDMRKRATRLEQTSAKGL